MVTAGSDEKCEAARKLDRRPITRSTTRPRISSSGSGTSPAATASNVVLDMIGGDYVPRNLKCLAEEGRHISIAVQRGAAGNDFRLFESDAQAAGANRIDAPPALAPSSSRWSPTSSTRTVWPYRRRRDD
jgi:NADPH:quinone reductase-like Zn-dependent oxidoreductase